MSNYVDEAGRVIGEDEFQPLAELYKLRGERVSELEWQLADTRQRYKDTAEGIMMSIDSSWRPNEERDWGRPELVLAEYVGELREQLAAVSKERNEFRAQAEETKAFYDDEQRQLTAMREERDELAAALELAKKGVTLAQAVRNRTTGLAILERSYKSNYLAGTTEYLEGLASQADDILQRLQDPKAILAAHDQALVRPLVEALMQARESLDELSMSFAQVCEGVCGV